MRTKKTFSSALFKTHFCWYFSAHLRAETFVKNMIENSSKKHWLKYIKFCQNWDEKKWLYRTLFHTPDLGKFWKVEWKKWLIGHFLFHMHESVYAQSEHSLCTTNLVWIPFRHAWGTKVTISLGHKTKIFDIFSSKSEHSLMHYKIGLGPL